MKIRSMIYDGRRASKQTRRIINSKTMQWVTSPLTAGLRNRSFQPPKWLGGTVGCGFLLLMITLAGAQTAVPPVVTYQGRLSAAGTNWNGLGYFKFAIVNGGTNLNRTANGYCLTAGGQVTGFVVIDGGSGYTTPPHVAIYGPPGPPWGGATAIAAVSGGTVSSVTVQTPGSNFWVGAFVAIYPAPPVYSYYTYWSNNGLTDGDGQPTSPVALTLSAGSFSAALGGEGMVYLAPEIFQQGDAQLRIWFSPSQEGPFQELTPAQPMTATPYAMVAAQAASVQGSNVVGTLPLSTWNQAFASPVVLTNSDNVLAGDGAALVNLDGGGLASGTVADARLSTNVALLSRTQTFTGQNTFKNPGDNGGSLRVGANAAGAEPKLVYFGGGSSLSIGENGADNRMELRADSFALLSNSGQGGVGINKTNPAATLDVNGTIAATGFTGSGAGLSNLDGGQIVSGSVTSAQLAPGTASANLADSGQSGVPSGGMILSDNPANAALAGAGYIKLGKVELISEKWNTNYASGPLDAGNLTQARSGHSAVWTGTEMIIWGGFNGTYLNDGYRYNPAANTWTAISRTNAPAARGGHCAVWTGSKMIVWGGADRTGGLYNPATDTWSAMSAVNAPPGYTSNAFAWTGTYLLVWGGIGDSYGEFDYLNQWSCADYGNGGRYNPSTDTWTAMSTNNAPGSRAQMAFAWTGAELVVWGGLYEYVVPGGFFSSGVVDEYYNTGARYNPSTDSWTPMTTNGAPSLRCGATAVWTGSQFLVWGGVTLVYTNDWFWGGSNYFPFNANTGGRYSPSGNSWSAMSSAGAPTPRSQHTALWTGSRMTVWGGSDDNGAAKTGGRYDPTANTWLRRW